MNTETAPETQEESLSESSSGSAWAGIAVVLGFVVGAVGLWFIQGDDSSNVKVPDPKNTPYDRPEVSETGPYPEVVVDNVEHRFDIMELGNTGTHTYVVTNEGEADLVLQQGPKSCACTRYDIEKPSLAKGESCKIIVEWKPKKADLEFLQSMNLYTNDPKNTVIPLRVAGVVAAKVKIIPKGVWDIGNLNASKEGKREGVVASGFLNSFELVDIKTSHPQLTVELVPARMEDLKSIRANHGLELHTTLGTAIPAGPFKGTITFRLKDHPDQEYKIDVKAHRDGSVVFQQGKGIFWDKRRQLVDLGQFPAKAGKIGELLLYLDGEQEMEASEITAVPSFLKCELKKDPTFRSKKKTRYILSFEVPPGAPTGGYKGRKAAKVNIKTDHPEYPELKLRVQFVTSQ